ncbi:LLM class F420-dependent oxidoreductase [Saccharothrix obliqua]|uniref:LLM class F420-dependent oxidoreductase n=1 Tax=Saccharothrix obliqua TaxID=2861747 RepID=UPI001C5FB721|nr:LLM class F420-dependent oxidoreductase [Saccharothrix obliqua]MBW4717762.1 LLM class F420-dependent oxidoreductase [Saccharothrix obliqua]
MELGVHGLNTRSVIGPADTAALARRAEQLGYGSWWTADHVVLPTSVEAETVVDPLVHLGFVAAVTSRIELATGVLILPQRNPLVLAKQAASLDVLSGGRLRLGVGAGWQREEMTAVGVPFTQRGRLTDEHIDAMRALWRHEVQPYHGEHVSFADVDALPKPLTDGGPHLVVGGHSAAALRRALTKAHGWYGIGNGPDDLARHLAALRDVRADVDRPAHLGELEVSFMHMGAATLTDDTARRYADLGLDRLVVYPLPIGDAASVTAFLERHADLPR